MKLNNKIAFVTGSSRGIGKAIALKYAELGAKVIVNATTVQAAQKTAEIIESNGGKSMVAAGDISSLNDLKSIFKKIFYEFDRLDILINNAGVALTKPTMDITKEELDKTIDINLKGVIMSCQLAAKKMFEQKHGSIINISSVWGSASAPERAVYCASKWGVEGFTKSIASEWGKKGIRVNGIAPGYTYTDQIKDLIKRGIIEEEIFVKRIPLGRFAAVEDIANAAVFLGSEKANYINGEILTVDGGFNAFGYVIK